MFCDAGRKNLRETQKNLWGAVEARLNVRVDSLSFIACRAKIDNLDNRALKAGKSQRPANYQDVV